MANPGPFAFFVRLYNAFIRLARRQWLACAVVFVFTLGLRVALLPWIASPNPTIHDEFSYLLAADTYGARSALANPTPQFWEHFETFQELLQPVYASKYPPLQGLALAFGQKFFSSPWIGVVLTCALMSAAVCWMLEGWVSAEWALVGALCFAFRTGVLSYWMNSFEGGAIPAIGGALALGAVARIGFRREYRHAATWALGLSVLIHSRPYDGAALGLTTAVALAWLLWKERRSESVSLVRAAVPAAAVFAVALGAMAWIDFRVTGNALTIPYLAHDRAYIAASPFSFVALPPQPAYRHSVMRDFYTGAGVEVWKEARSQPIIQLLGRLYIVIGFLFGAWPVALLLLLWPFALQTREERMAAAIASAGVVSLIPLAGIYPHYAAAFAPAFLLRFVQSLSRLASSSRSAGPRWGLAAAAAVIAMFVFSGRDPFSTVLAERSANFGAARDTMEHRLEALPGKQLVLVRYAPGHNTQNEWVFNAADLEASKVIWAREIAPNEDRPFVSYFRERQAWLLEADRNPPAPYAVSATATGSAGAPHSHVCAGGVLLYFSNFAKSR